MSGRELAVPRKFVFWSGSYAFATLLWTAMIVTFLFTLGFTPWMPLFYLPFLAVAWLGARHSRISVELEGDTLRYLAGIGPARTIALRPSSTPAEDPYRALESAGDEVNRAEVRVEQEKGLHNASESPVAEVLLTVLAPSLAHPITVDVGRLTVTDADGRVRRIRIPGGDSDELAKLRDAINRKAPAEDDAT